MAFSVLLLIFIWCLSLENQLLGAFIRRARMEFKTAIIIAPTSANTANQIFAIPRAHKIMIIALSSKETAMFSRAIE